MDLGPGTFGRIREPISNVQEDGAEFFRDCLARHTEIVGLQESRVELSVYRLVEFSVVGAQDVNGFLPMCGHTWGSPQYLLVIKRGLPEHATTIQLRLWRFDAAFQRRLLGRQIRRF